MSAPGVPKKEKKEKAVARPVYLPPSKWAELDEIARFEEAVFKEQGDEQSVSRNDVVVAHLEWSTQTFWEDKGGRPDTEADFRAKVKAHVQRLDRERRSRKAKEEAD